MSSSDRLPPVADAALTSDQQDAVADFKRTRKTAVLEGPFVPLLRSPELLRRTQRVGAYLRYHSALAPRLSEMVILITARHWCQQFEWQVHAVTAADAGLPASTIEAIATGRRPDELADDEAAVYELCRELLQNRCVSDVTYARALALFGERGIVDTTGIVGYYSLLAMVMNTAQTPVRDGTTPPLEPFPR